LGAAAKAASTTPEQRSEIARNAALARWNKSWALTAEVRERISKGKEEGASK